MHWKIRCDEKSYKILKIWRQLNKGLVDETGATTSTVTDFLQSIGYHDETERNAPTGA